jgi:hypothetical protein
MKRLLTSFSVVALALSLTALPATAEKDKVAEPMIVHDVYFTLKDNSPAAQAKLVAACKKYLSGHPGTVYFSAGVLAKDLNRDVNDRDWDVALHLVFENKAAHDKYQDAERHKKFIEENKDNWKKVRVFDSADAPSAVK